MRFRLIPQPKSPEARQRLYVVNISCLWVINITIFVILWFWRKGFWDPRFERHPFEHNVGGLANYWEAVFSPTFPPNPEDLWNFKIRLRSCVCVLDHWAAAINTRRRRSATDKRRLVSTLANLAGAHAGGVPWEILLVFQPPVHNINASDWTIHWNENFFAK